MRYNGFKRNRNKFQEQKTKGSAVIVQNNNVDKAFFTIATEIKNRKETN